MRTLSIASSIILMAVSPSIGYAYTAGRISTTATAIHLQPSRVIPAGQNLLVETLNLSTGADSVIHVQLEPSGDFVGGNDDCPTGLGSCLLIPSTGASRTVSIIVRAYATSTPGTATLRITPQGGAAENTAINFGGARHDLPGALISGAHVFSVEKQGGPTDTIVMVVNGSTGIAYNDDNGIGLMSWLHLTPPCGANCSLIVGAFQGTPTGPVELLWDEDIHYNNCDSDGLGNALETAVGSEPCVNDTDDDGISDGAEVIGLAGPPDVKFRYMGADPLQKDLFLEADWKECLTFGCTTINMFQLSGSRIQALAAFFAPSVSLHVDNGLVNTDPATRTMWGAWGGAQRLPNLTGCEALTPSRVDYFHHAFIYDGPGAAGTAPDGLGGYCIASGNSPGIMAQELGHNFTLDHGGTAASGLMNCKPHYKSPMNYAYTGSATAFSSGVMPGSLVPASISETSGLGTGTDTTHPHLKLPPWEFDIRADGAVDWNRDGIIQAGSSRGAPTWADSECDTSVQRRSTLPNTEEPSSAWVTAGAVSRLYVVSRRVSDGKLEYRYTTSLTSCGVLSQNYGSCATWSPSVSLPATLLSTSTAASMGPALLEFGRTATQSKLLVVYVEAATAKLRYQVMTLTSGGALAVTAPAAVGSGSDLIFGAPALALSGGNPVLLAPTTSGVLKSWSWTGSAFNSGSSSLWNDGTTVSAVTGIALAPGYQTDVSGQSVYAAIPVSSPAGQIELARLNPVNGRWIKFGTAVWPDGQASTTARPGLAYVPWSNATPALGRFYLAWNGGSQNSLQIAQTEGNDPGVSATTRRLQFSMAIDMFNQWQDSYSGVNLFYDMSSLARDANLRSVWQNDLNETIFAPLADGIVNMELRDVNDYTYILAYLKCSLTRSCP